MAGEREFLESLFGIKDEGRWVGSVHAYSLRSRGVVETSDEDRVKALLDKDFEGCGRPLKVRQLFLLENRITLAEILYNIIRSEYSKQSRVRKVV